MPRVLVVDDDPMVCTTIEACLTRKGFEVTVADGGEAGMRALEASDFDVMLIDVFMPHMRGFESVRMFHERRPDVPVVAMSGYAFANAERAPDFLPMTIELGAACCLRKPFTQDDANYLPGPDDIYVSPSQIRRFGAVDRRQSMHHQPDSFRAPFEMK